MNDEQDVQKAYEHALKEVAESRRAMRQWLYHDDEYITLEQFREEYGDLIKYDSVVVLGQEVAELCRELDIPILRTEGRVPECNKYPRWVIRRANGDT